jgi:integrase
MPRLGSKGHLSQQKPGATYHGIWYRNGARFCENLQTADEAEARARLDALIERCEADAIVKPETRPPAISAMLGQALRFYKVNKRKSIDCVERHVERLKRAFRGLNAVEVTRGRINDYVDRRLAELAANATVNRELAVLRLAYSLARKDGKIRPEHVPAFDMLKENNRRKGFFEQHEYEAVLEHLPEYLKGAFTMAYWTGMRKSEIFGLKWEQVDLFARLVSLERTKNGEDRTLPLNDELYSMLAHEWTRKWDGCPYIFHNGPLLIRDFRKAWYTACAKAGVGRFVEGEAGKPVWEGKIFHDLRRTGVRNLIRAGVAQSIAMRISGHKDARIFARYDIVDTRDVAEAMRKVAAYEAEKRLARERQKVLGSFAFIQAGNSASEPITPFSKLV